MVDTYGETSKFYSLSNITFVGGSIIKHGGQNPLEPARLGNYIINGPYVSNFKEIYKFLVKNKLSLTTSNILTFKKFIEKKLNKPVLSSNQALIWDTLENIGRNVSINGFGKLFLSN